eukprot:6425984-Prymnesium_polylepis.1
MRLTAPAKRRSAQSLCRSSRFELPAIPRTKPPHTPRSLRPSERLRRQPAAAQQSVGAGSRALLTRGGALGHCSQDVVSGGSRRAIARR